LKSRNSVRLSKESYIERFAVIGILRVLRRLSAQQVIPAIAYFGDIAQSQLAGRDSTVGGRSDLL